MPTVSAIVPVYNVERYVGAAIASVLAQTYTDFEIVAVDDGSTDTSLSILRGFHDPRLRIVTQANRGLAGARNTGIRHARGRYGSTLDYLAETAAALRAHGVRDREIERLMALSRRHGLI